MPDLPRQALLQVVCLIAAFALLFVGDYKTAQTWLAASLVIWAMQREAA